MPTVTKKYYHNIDLDNNQLINAVVENLATAPVSPVDGQIYYNTVDKKIYYYKSSIAGWIAIGSDVVYQVPITLTTTGTSGPATFNSGTGALNIPQYSVGTGTTNYLTKWSSSSALGTSVIYDNGSIVSIGTATPNTQSRLTLMASNTVSKSVVLDSTWDYQTSFAMKNGIYSTEFNLGGASKSAAEGGPGSLQVSTYNASTFTYRYPVTFFASANVAFAGPSGSVPSDNGATVQVNGSIYAASLAGTGSRMVIALSTGVLSTQAIPSGNSGTVTSVGLTVPTGLSVANSPITSSGTLDITFATGYSIPTTASQTNWNTAYGWGNHASAGYQVTSEKGQINGYASLDGSGLVPASQLPSYVDDVLEYANLAGFPATGTTGKIYVALDTNETYRWSGSAYVRIANGAVQSVNGNTGIVTITLASLGGISLTSLSSTATGLTYTNTTGVFSLTSGYSIPTTASQTNWDTAFTERRYWDGGSTNLVAATGRTSLGATTVGSNVFTLTNPSAVTFLRINADNTVSALDAATFRTAIGAGTSSTSGTVTNVTITTANGVSGSTTGTGALAITVTLGAITPTSVNSVVISGSSTPTLAVTGTSSISGSNTGDNAVNSLYSGLVSNATHTGDATGATALTVVGLRGVALPTLSATAGFLRYTGTGTNTWVFDSSTYLTANQSIALSGDVSGTGTTAITTTLATVTQSTGSSFVKITLDTKGRVTGNTTVAASDLHSTFGSQTANTFYAAPNGTAGNPAFRAIVAADIPTLNQNTTGSAGSVANSFVIRADSGTTEGNDLYTFNGSAGKNLNIVGGTNITITKAAGQWTIAATGTGGTSLNGTGYVKMAGTTPSYIASIPNTDLANSSITVQGTAVSLGGSVNVINGTGFVKVSGTTISYDNSTYYLASNPSGYTNNTGTVTSVSVVTANGVSGSVTATATPAITITLGAITPTSVNSVVISGSTTPTLAVTGTSSISGSNTGDNAVNSLYSGLVSNATHTGDATGSTALTVVGLRGVALPTLGASAGFLRYTGTGTNTWVFDTSTYLTANQSITLSGAVTGSGTTAITTTLANSVVGIANLSATGTPSATTYLRGDNTWATIAGGGITTLNTLTDISQTFATATTGTDFTISSASGVHTFNLPDASATARGLVTTGVQTFAGNKTFSGTVNVSSIFTVGTSNQFRVAIGYSSASETWAGVTGSSVGMYYEQPTLNTFSAVSVSHITHKIFGATITEAASGTVSLISQLGIKPLAITEGGATTTNAATLYIEGAATGTATITNNYAVWIDDGAVRLDILGGTGTRMVVADATGVLSTQAINTGTVTSVALATGTTGTDVNISGSPITTSGTITLNIPDASATARGLVTTGTQSFAGDKRFAGTISFGLATPTSANLYVVGGGNIAGLTGITLQGASLVGRVYMGSDTSGSLGNGNAYSGVTIGGNSVFVNTTNPLIATLSLKSTGNSTVGTITNSATLYIEAASTAATNNYSVWVDAGNVRIDDKLLIGTGLDNGAYSLQVTGQIRLNSYTTTTSYTGTPVGYLAFDTSGNIITVAAPSGSGITTLNTLTDTTQTFATSTTGTDFTISSATGVHTFNLPDASATARGLVTTGNQSFAGSKTFSGSISIGSTTLSTSFFSSGAETWGGISLTSVSRQYRFGYSSTQTLPASGSGSMSYSFSGHTITGSSGATYPLVAGVAVRAGVLNTATSTFTNYATLYIESAATGTGVITNNYALWVDDGTVRLDGAVEMQGIASATKTDVLYYDSTTKRISYGAAPTGSGSAYTVTSVSTTYSETATSGTKIIKADTSGGTFVITLPTAVGNTATIIVKKTAGSAALTIDGASTETIDGGLTATINKVYESITLISDNTNWQIV